ncbi:MAG: type IV secretion system DNA-binding domain-containing protein [Patescibacteria group bacterium]
MPIEYNHDHENEITLFGATNFRNQLRRFGIKTDDRRRHMYVLGKTGMGKTTLLENLVLSDIMAGHGVCYIDPHGDTAEKMLDYIPSHRINDVVYFNPADQEFPVGFNILETTNEEQKHLVASGLMGVFKKIWPDVWSPRMEYILLNCVLALLDYPGATLLGINRLLVDKEYRTRVIAKIRNPIVKTFWLAEFTSWSEKYATEAIAPVQNKVGQFLSASIIRNIVAQVKSTINPRQVMDEGKILIVNLSKGKIGEDNMRLLGGMIVTKIQLAAMERVDIKNESDRRDFYLYVDEFQNFANQSFANILSEARKYRLNLIVAHQYIKQLEEEVADAVFGNVGTLLIMRVGAEDASFLETEFMPTFTPEDLVNLPKYQLYLKLMVDGVSTQPFSATTLPSISSRTGSEEKVVAVSRERYAEHRSVMEEKILRWSGMEAVGAAAGVTYPDILTEDEQEKREASAPKYAAPVTQMLATLEPTAAKPSHEALDSSSGSDSSEYLRMSPERLSAISKPPQPAKKEKPKFPHTCTRCGKVWDMPIQLDTSRPIYCAECLPLVREEKKTKKTVMRSAMAEAFTTDNGSPVVVDSSGPANDNAATRLKALDPDLMAKPAPRPSKPRIVGERRPMPASPAPAQKGTVTIVRDDKPVTLSLMQELERAKGKPIETNKRKLEAKEPYRAPIQAPKEKPMQKPAPRPGLDIDLGPLPAPVAREPRSATVFRQTISSVNPQGGGKSLKPGERVTFDDAT